MEKRNRIRSLTYYAAALVFVTVIICGCYTVSVYLREPATIPSLSSPSPPPSLLYSFLRYFVFMAGIFLCPLVLQGEDILKIYRRRKSLHIRWELIILGAVALLFSFIKIWFHLLFPVSKIYEIGLFAAFIIDGYSLEIPYMFAAGIFFVRGFCVQDALIEKKERATYLALGASVIILIAVINYGWMVFAQYLWTHSSIVANPVLPAVVMISCSFIIQGEDILKIYCRRKSLLIRRELIILGVIAFLLDLLAVSITWSDSLYQFLCGIKQDSFLYMMINGIIGNGVLSIIYLYAAGMLFVRAFHVCQDSDCEMKTEIL